MDENFKKTLLIVLSTVILTSLYFVTAIISYHFGKNAGNKIDADTTCEETETESMVPTNDISSDSEKPPKETSTTMQPTKNSHVEPDTTTSPSNDSHVTTPLDSHGRLYVNGIDLLDENHQSFQLKGVSTHGLQWYPEYVNYKSFKTLRDDWHANVIRLAMYTGEGGYMTGGNQSELEKKIDDGISYCTELGMYCIIDWHILSDGNPNQYKDGAKEFFKKMSEKYKNHKNVLYEICNEPNGGASWSDVKSYADEIISVIRSNDNDGIIIVGTPTWSQDVDVVAANPVSNPHNVMYALHFYAATHKDDLRNKVTTARNNQTPVIISEFSICEASGNGSIDYESAGQWSDLIDNSNLSYIGWNLSNKNELSALIAPDCSKTSGWNTDELSETGKWLREKMLNSPESAS